MLLLGRQKRRFVFDEQSLDGPKLLRLEAQIASQRDRIEPELSGYVVPIDVDVRRLAQVMTVEVDPVWARTQHGRQERAPLGTVIIRAEPVGDRKRAIRLGRDPAYLLIRLPMV